MKQKELNAIVAKAVKEALGSKTTKIKGTSLSECKTWVAKKRSGAKFISSVKANYVRGDGQSIPVTNAKFDNGETYQVSANRFWKLK